MQHLKQRRSPLLYSLFLKHGERQDFSKSTVAYTTKGSDGLMLVDAGFIKRYMITNDGSKRVQIIYGPADIFSFTKLYRYLFDQQIYSGPETYYYEAVSDASVIFLSAEVLKKAVIDNLQLYRELFFEAGEHLRSCVHNIESIAMENAYRRVAHRLLFFAQQFGEKRRGGVEIQITLTHQLLAEMLGTTRETVTIAITKLRKNGLIKGSRHILIPSIKMLESAVYSVPRV